MLGLLTMGTGQDRRRPREIFAGDEVDLGGRWALVLAVARDGRDYCLWVADAGVTRPIVFAPNSWLVVRGD